MYRVLVEDLPVELRPFCAYVSKKHGYRSFACGLCGDGFICASVNDFQMHLINYHGIDIRKPPEQWPMAPIRGKQLYLKGFNIVPFSTAKKPLVDSWKQWQSRRQTVEEFNNMPEGPLTAVVCCPGFEGPRLITIDIDYDTVSSEEVETWLRNFLAIFQGLRQKTPHGEHHYFLVDRVIRSMNIPGLFELKAFGSLVIVEGPGYESVDVAEAPKIEGERLDAFLRALETLRKLRQIIDDHGLLHELRRKGERSEADLRLMIKLLKHGWGEEDIRRAWALLSAKAPDETLRRNADHYFAITYKKALEYVRKQPQKTDDERKEKSKTFTVLSRVLPGGVVLESIAARNSTGEFDSQLLIYNNGIYTVVDRYEIDGAIIWPRNPRSYPYEPYEYVEGPAPNRLELIDQIHNEVDMFVDAEPEVKALLTSIILLSYVQEKFEALPYTYLVGDNESGKSHTLNLLTWLCYRPFAGVSHTAADLYSYLEDDGLPLTIIEDEFQGSEKDNDKMKIYKSGYKRGVKIARVTTYEGGRRIDYYNSYGLKIMAGEHLVENKGLLQRCIVVELMEGYPMKDHYEADDYERFRALRNTLLKWRMHVLAGEEDLPKPGTELRGRSRELYLPILTILHGHRFYDIVYTWVKQLEEKTMVEKKLSLEGLLTEAVYRVLIGGHEEVGLDEIWFTLRDVAGGEILPNKTDIMVISHIGEVSKKLVGRRLRELFGASRRYTKKDGKRVVYYLFNREKVEKMTRKYRVNGGFS